jgi:dTDP-4-amino-4,6-dideoxygalactose transaminase
MKIPFLDLSRIEESLKERLKAKFSEMLDAGVFSGGKEVELLESSISKILNSPFSIPCANGTDALELALRALGIGSGDEVIVPAMTWVSTAEAVVLVGAKPVFVDTDEDGLISSDWEKAITPQTKAVIPVHLYGKMVEMSPLLSKAKSHGLFVIEDAAQAFGAFQNGKAAGTWGDVGCLSFYPTKNLGALGEAGMCLTSSKELADKIRLISNHGQPVRDQHELVGRNSRIDSIQAGFLNVFLEKWEDNLAKRKSLAQIYLKELAGISDIRLPSGLELSDHNAHLFVIQTERRDELKAFLGDNGIGTAIHYPMILPEMKPFAFEGDFENARKLSRTGFSLPLNPWLRESEVREVIEKVREFYY